MIILIDDEDKVIEVDGCKDKEKIYVALRNALNKFNDYTLTFVEDNINVKVVQLNNNQLLNLFSMITNIPRSIGNVKEEDDKDKPRPPRK